MQTEDELCLDLSEDQEISESSESQVLSKSNDSSKYGKSFTDDQFHFSFPGKSEFGPRLTDVEEDEEEGYFSDEELKDSLSLSPDKQPEYR